MHTHHDLDQRVTRWRDEHRSGTLRDAITDLGLWLNPDDRDAQWFVRDALKERGDPAAMEGFPQMRVKAQVVRRRTERVAVDV
jgi:hypothetical protein